MIEPILHFFKIHRKMIFGKDSIIVKNMFGVTPKTFNAVDMVFGFLVDHVFGVVDSVMLSHRRCSARRYATSHNSDDMLNDPTNIFIIIIISKKM